MYRNGAVEGGRPDVYCILVIIMELEVISNPRSICITSLQATESGKWEINALNSIHTHVVGKTCQLFIKVGFTVKKEGTTE